MCVLSFTQSCQTLCDPVDCSSPGSSAHEISQARILEWVAIPFSRRSSQSRDETHVLCFSCIGRQILYHWATWDMLPFRKPGHGEATTSLQLVLLSFILSYVRRNTHVLLLSSCSRFLVGITYSQIHCKHPLLCSVLNLGSTGYYVYIYQHNPGTKLAQQSAMVLWWVMPLVYW